MINPAFIASVRLSRPHLVIQAAVTQRTVNLTVRGLCDRCCSCLRDATTQGPIGLKSSTAGLELPDAGDVTSAAGSTRTLIAPANPVWWWLWASSQSSVFMTCLRENVGQ
jgi:hypothetical protein